MMQPMKMHPLLLLSRFGMAVAQAQHALREMVDTLKNDIKVLHVIHPVATECQYANVFLYYANAI